MTRFIFTAVLLVFLSTPACVLHSMYQTESEPVDLSAGYGSLARFKFKEGWYGVYYYKDKVGYMHFKIEPQGEDFLIENETFLRLTSMKTINETKITDFVKVRPDLSMISLESKVLINDKLLRVTGKVSDGKFFLKMQAQDEKMERDFPVKDKLYHTSAVILLPALLGLKEGAVHSFQVFDGDKRVVENRSQEVSSVKGSQGMEDAAWKIRNLSDKAVVDFWVNKDGLRVIEKSGDGSLMIILEDKDSAMKFLEKKSPTRDLAYDVSFIKTAKSIPNPAKLSYLKAKFSGIDSSLIPSDERQQVGRPDAADKSFVVISKAVGADSLGGSDLSNDSPEPIEDDFRIPSKHPEITAQAKKIVSKDDSPLNKVQKLTKWTSENIASTGRDSFDALTVLRNKEGECQSHAKLYTALARSQDIPTRIVTGLVYISDRGGFLYHAWTESFVQGWLAVDPTFNQVPADATHIKISSGDSDESTSLMKIVGKLKIEILEFR